MAVGEGVLRRTMRLCPRVSRRAIQPFARACVFVAAFGGRGLRPERRRDLLTGPEASYPCSQRHPHRCNIRWSGNRSTLFSVISSLYYNFVDPWTFTLSIYARAEIM